MADQFGPTPYLGEIRIFGGNFGPQNWALCDGKILKITDYPELFDLIGNTYGGDGVSTFGLPDLQGRVPVHIGANYDLGKKGGEETVMLNENELPLHTHDVWSDVAGGENEPNGNYWGYSTSNPYALAPGNIAMNRDSVTSYGKGHAHENRIPYQVVNYIIALKGDYPTGE